MAVTQTQYPHPQPAQKSSKGLWIVIGTLAAVVIAVAIFLYTNINSNDRRTDSMNNSLSKSADSGAPPGAPAGNASASSSAKPDNNAISSSTVGDPRIEETLNNYVAALGGREAIESVTSRVAKGTLEMPDLGVAGTVETYQKAPNKYVFIMNVPSMGVVRSGYNGSTGWAQELNLELRRLEGAELEAMKREADFYKEIRLKDLYSKLSFDGKQSVEGHDANVITAIPPEGGSQKWYFDAKTGLLLRTDEDRQTLEGTNTTESYIDQYKMVNGINLPFQMRMESGMVKFVIKIKEITHNVPINDSIFNMPNY